MTRPKLAIAPLVAPRRHNKARVKQAVRLFRSIYAPRSVRRHNAAMWLRAVELLGERWHLATPIKPEKRA